MPGRASQPAVDSELSAATERCAGPALSHAFLLAVVIWCLPGRAVVVPLMHSDFIDESRTYVAMDARQLRPYLVRLAP